jgi:hypothetical protein
MRWLLSGRDCELDFNESEKDGKHDEVVPKLQWYQLENFGGTCESIHFKSGVLIGGLNFVEISHLNSDTAGSLYFTALHLSIYNPRGSQNV